MDFLFKRLIFVFLILATFGCVIEGSDDFIDSDNIAFPIGNNQLFYEYSRFGLHNIDEAVSLGLLTRDAAQKIRLNNLYVKSNAVSSFQQTTSCYLVRNSGSDDVGSVKFSHLRSDYYVALLGEDDCSFKTFNYTVARISGTEVEYLDFDYSFAEWVEGLNVLEKLTYSYEVKGTGTNRSFMVSNMRTLKAFLSAALDDGGKLVPKLTMRAPTQYDRDLVKLNSFIIEWEQKSSTLSWADSFRADQRSRQLAQERARQRRLAEAQREENRFINQLNYGDGYYIPGVFSDQLVYVVQTNPRTNQVKVRRADDGSVVWVDADSLIDRATKDSNDVVRSAATIAVIACLFGACDN